MNSTIKRISQFTLTLIVIACAGMSAVGQDGPSAELAPHHRLLRLTAGDHIRKLVVGELTRTAIVHVPHCCNLEKPTPVVLAIHGAAMSASIMVSFCGMNETADEKGFIVVYPNGTGPEPLLTWNAGGFREGLGTQADDVTFLKTLLDDVATVVNVDPKRVYACGMSNGGMMCYRLAAELSDRIAAIAPVAGTMPAREVRPQRPVSVIHFHGTQDKLVPFEMVGGKSPFWLKLKSVDATIETWVKIDGCGEKPPVTDVLTNDGDDLKVTRQTYGPGVDETEVVLVTVEGGGHSWPGQVQPFRFLGKSTLNVSANELIWAFFEKHPLK